jgi:hypothetical protein
VQVAALCPATLSVAFDLVVRACHGGVQRFGAPGRVHGAGIHHRVLSAGWPITTLISCPLQTGEQPDIVPPRESIPPFTS